MLSEVCKVKGVEYKGLDSYVRKGDISWGYHYLLGTIEKDYPSIYKALLSKTFPI